MKVVIYLSLLAFHFSLCNAQQRKIDSLTGVIKTMKDDTGKVITMNILCDKLYKAGQQEKALEIGIDALDLASKLSYTRGEADGFRNVGQVYYVQLKYADALRNYTLAYKAYQMLKDTFQMGFMATRKGLVYFRQANYPLALQEDFLSLKLREAIKDSIGMTSTYINLGNVNSEQANYTEALKYENMALTLSIRLKRKMNESACYINIGGIEVYLKEYQKALDNFRKALVMGAELKDDEGIAITYSDIGEVFHDMNKDDSAMVYYTRSLQMKHKIGYKRGFESSYIEMSYMYNARKQFVLARIYADSALKASLKTGSVNFISMSYSELAHADSNLGDFKQALEEYVHSVSWKDSLTNQENTKKSVQAEMNYEFDKKQALEKLEQDKKDALQHEAERKQRVTIYFISSILILVIAFALFVMRSLQQNRKKTIIISKQKEEVEKQKTVVEEQNSLIEQQKAIVEEKNKDITDSIKYASRIQRALFTSDEYISKHMKEHFILFKPRDIVSGDFYWAYSNPQNETFNVACCDCTGHGVPGAFMSLLNISMLNESVIERNIIRPDKVLNDIRDNIIKALNPEKVDSESKDGMDCALCAFDFKNSIMQSASANNPVWIIRKDGAFEEIAPDKMPVGIQHGEQKPFTLQTTKLNMGDSVYMFTDGYADQFGGPKGKKFKYKALQQLILDNCHLTMQAQKGIFENALEQWKGNLEQVDDILIVGIRI